MNTKKAVVCLAIASSCLLLCAATKRASLTFDQPTVAPLEAAKCAARMSGWTVASSDATGLSATKVEGLDSVPLTLNVMLQGENTLLVILNSPRMVFGNGSTFTRGFTGAFADCGATPKIEYLK